MPLPVLAAAVLPSMALAPINGATPKEDHGPLMRIVDIREKTVSIASDIANAYIDFSKMTCSVVAVVTDVERDGRG